MDHWSFYSGQRTRRSKWSVCPVMVSCFQENASTQTIQSFRDVAKEQTGKLLEESVTSLSGASSGSCGSDAPMTSLDLLLQFQRLLVSKLFSTHHQFNKSVGSISAHPGKCTVMALSQLIQVNVQSWLYLSSSR